MQIEDFTEPKQEIRPFKKESNHLSHKEALKEAAKDALVKCNMLKLRHSTEQKERFWWNSFIFLSFYIL